MMKPPYVTVIEEWRRNPDGTTTYTRRIQGHPDRVMVYEMGKAPLLFLDDNACWAIIEKMVHPESLR